MKFILTIFSVLAACILHAQNDSVKYTRDFVFKDGIYITKEDFINNKPNLKSENFKQYNQDIEYLDNSFFENKKTSGTQGKLFYPDPLGNIHEVEIDSLFGYVVKNHLFLLTHMDIGNSFKVLRVFRLGIVSYCFDIDRKHSQMIVNPMVFLSPGSSGVLEIPAKEEEQYLLNFNDLQVHKYDSNNFERELKKIDDSLYNEFTQLSNSKKNKMMFIYLNKVNEKHPIYFKN